MSSLLTMQKKEVSFHLSQLPYVSWKLDRTGGQNGESAHDVSYTSACCSFTDADGVPHRQLVAAGCHEIQAHQHTYNSWQRLATLGDGLSVRKTRKGHQAMNDVQDLDFSESIPVINLVVC